MQNKKGKIAMTEIKNLMKTSTGKIMLGLLAVVLVFAAFNAILAPSRQERIIRAHETVDNLYSNDGNNFSIESITEEELDNILVQINKLPKAERDVLNEKIQPVQEQFEMYELTQTIFASNPLEEEAELLIHESATLDGIKEAEDQLNNYNDNSYGEEVKSALDNAGQMIQDMDQIIIDTEEFNQIGSVTRNNLYQVVEQANNLTEQYTQYENQPYLNGAQTEYEQTMDNMVETIINGSYYGDYDQETLDLIFENHYLVEGLKGSPLNPTPVISLTFDDGPNPEYTPQILDILAENEVKAAFFVYGAYVDEYPEIAQRIVAEGHILGNHTYTHPDLSAISDEEVLQEIEWTQESIRDVTGVEPTLYRMPFGAGGPRVVRLLSDMTSIIWNIDSQDWELQDEELIYNTVMTQLSHDNLLLMHDTNQATVNAVRRMIPEMKEQGFEFVKPTEVDFSARYFE